MPARTAGLLSVDMSRFGRTAAPIEMRQIAECGTSINRFRVAASLCRSGAWYV
jgi:hypothetical protein